MKKYAFLMTAIFLIVVSTSGCTFNAGSQTYDANGIKFNYPMGWKELSPEQLSATGTGNAEVIAVVADPNIIQNNNYQVLAWVQKIAITRTLPDAISVQKTAIQNATGQLVSEKNVTVNGVQGTELVYTITTPSGVAKKERMIAFDKNSVRYYLVFSAPTANYDSEQSNFDMIVNSFQVK